MAPKDKRTQYAVANITPVGTALNAVVAFVEAVSRSAGYEPSLHCRAELEAAKEAINEIGQQSVTVHDLRDDRHQSPPRSRRKVELNNAPVLGTIKPEPQSVGGVLFTRRQSRRSYSSGRRPSTD